MEIYITSKFIVIHIMVYAKKWYFVDVRIPQDHRVVMKENKKIDKYLELVDKAQTENHVKVEIIAIVIGAMGTVPKWLKN